MSDTQNRFRNETQNETKRSWSPLDDLVREARAAAPPDLDGIDWKKVEAGLFERVRVESQHARALAAHRGGSSGWMWLGGLAAAAMTAIATSPTSTAYAPMDASVAHAGAHARSGETIETHGTPALFESKGRVSWLLENDSKVRIERIARGEAALVLALAHGAIEAQVAPVASGEAFAVDVEGVRIAVHGTHLRVAREGDHVVVDLSEGVVSIGAPPKVGSTYGQLVTAPAHVEFRADTSATSISINHDAGSVRQAEELQSFAEERVSTNQSAHSSSRSLGPVTHEPAPAKEQTVSTPMPSTLQETPRPQVRSSSTPTAPNPSADVLVANAVSACAAGHPHSTDLVITVTSTLTVEVQDDGFAHRANFDPPLAPEVQACASQAIYSTRFAGPGQHKIAITLER